MIDLTALRCAPVFEHLTEEQLRCLPFVEQGEEVWAQDGERVVHEGEPAAFYVLLEGELQVLKKVGDQEMLLTTHPTGAFFGEVSLLLGMPFVASGRAVGRCRLYRLDEAGFWSMLGSCPTVTRSIMQTMAGRVQNLEAVAQGREKLVSLGTMAAGLAHELNNPAAASHRAAGQLREAILKLQTLGCQLHEQPLTPDHYVFLAGVQRTGMEGVARAPRLGPLEQSDREDAAAAWLEERHVPEAWNLAPTFVSAGLGVEWAETVAARVPGPALRAVIAWLEASLTVAELLHQVEQSSERVADLVKAVKAYSFMDQAPRQEVDVHEGLDSTLTMLGHKLKGIRVVRCYDRSCPPIQAFGGELNQVWTNLIDNAADAAGEGGEIRVSTSCEHDHLLVEIDDNGPGIPPELRGRIFEPFFTTKGVGKGTGLGLVTSFRIVVGRHGGDLRVDSEPGDTRFQVRLPVDVTRKEQEGASDGG
jgi:signal transduction histidine kinase